MPDGKKRYMRLLDKENPWPADQRWNGMIVYAQDAKTGKVYASAGADQAHDPASLNKLMVFTLTMKAVKEGRLSLDDTFPVPKKASKGVLESSRLNANAKYNVSSLLDALMIASDNGAAVVLGDALEAASLKEPGSSMPTDNEMRQNFLLGRMPTVGVMPQDALQYQMAPPKADFAPLIGFQEQHQPLQNLAPKRKPILQQMNGMAKAIGMQHTHYINPHGLPPEDPKGDANSTTARDMATLVSYIYENYRPSAKIFMGQDEVTYGDAKEKSHHRLSNPQSGQYLKDYEVLAKTGYIKLANHNIAGIFTDPAGHSVIMVVLGAARSSLATRKQIGLLEDMKGSVKGSYLRDELVQQLAWAIEKEHAAEEKAAGLAPAKTEKAVLGQADVKPLAPLPWKDVPARSGTIVFDGHYAEPVAPTVKGQRPQAGQGLK